MSLLCSVGKVLLKIMYYNTVLLHKKAIALLFIESNALQLLLRYCCFTWAWLASLFFNNKKKNFHTKSDMNKPQAEGNANSHLYNRGCS